MIHSLQRFVETMENINENNEKIRKQKEQVELNFKAFSKKLPELITLQMNKYALMRDGEIVEVYNSWEDAYKTGLRFFEDELFSVQKITNNAVDLGFFSHAVHIR